MKILIINKSYQTGGAAIASQYLCKSFIIQGVDAQFMIFDITGPSEGDQINLTRNFIHKIKWWFSFFLEHQHFAQYTKGSSSILF
ncbi:MAG: hypothetical protein ABIJ40_07230 [Bacteroidota bacterium]|nr:hypothetical protein [bacterium]MBU1874763.1 hypothetical protein [bacterium]